MKTAILIIGIMIFLMPGTASAHPTHSLKQQLHTQQVKYYHADGYIKSIGHVAYRTIYSSNPRIRHTWKRALHWLVGQRADARRMIAVLTAPTWPPHHALWMCLLPHEGGSWSNQNTGRNGHWGGLQMHPNWGYGTSYHASDDSQLTQEWAAERGYRASGYRYSFLTQQWGETIGYCSSLA